MIIRPHYSFCNEGPFNKNKSNFHFEKIEEIPELKIKQRAFSEMHTDKYFISA